MELEKKNSLFAVILRLFPFITKQIMTAKIVLEYLEAHLRIC